jgi:exosome complex component RRP41
LSLPEEQELPFITIGTTTALPAASAAAAEDDVDDMKVSVLHMETRAHTSYLDAMLAVGIDGCKQIREILEGVIKGSNGGVVPGAYGGGDESDEMDI